MKGKTSSIINTLLLLGILGLLGSQMYKEHAAQKALANTPDAEIEKFLPTERRTAHVASFLLGNGLPLNYQAREYLYNVQKDILQDLTNLSFHSVIYSDTGYFTAGQLKDEETITLYNEWDVKLGKDSAFLENFPRVPILAVNFEAIKRPECKDGGEPFMLWAKATRNGEVWDEEPTVMLDEEKGIWRVIFGDLKIIDKRSFDRRLFVVTYCNNQADKELSKETPEDK